MISKEGMLKFVTNVEAMGIFSVNAQENVIAHCVHMDFRNVFRSNDKHATRVAI